MKKYRVTAEMEFEVEIDETSKEFKNALEGYRIVIDSNGDEEDVIEHAVYTVCKFGNEQMVEGVGYVSTNDITPMNYKTGLREKSSGINLIGKFDINGIPDIYIELDELD